MPVTRCALLRQRGQSPATRQRGLSLVELMIGIAVGLFIVAAATFMLSNQLHDSRRLMLETQIQQDLRAAADIVVRDLRRGGHWGGADRAVWFRGTTRVGSNPYMATQGFELNAPSERVNFSYARDASENDVVDPNERFGFRLNNGALELQLGERSDGTPNWQPLTDNATLTITRFDLTLRRHDIDLAKFCARPCPASAPSCAPLQQVREVEVAIEGHGTGDPSVRRSVKASVRPRNDPVAGACPA